MRLVGRLPEKILCNQLFDARLIHTLRFEFGADFVGGFAAHKGFCLCKDVGKQDFVVSGRLLRFQAKAIRSMGVMCVP